MMNGIVDSGTRIQLSALCANINGQTTTPSQTTGTVSATRGSEYDSTLTIGDTGVVYAVAVKAGTLNETVESISFDFSKDPSKYIDSFNLYKNNTRVQNIDAKKATLLNGQYRLTLKDLRTDIARNTTETFTLHAEVKDSLASSYADDSISVLVPTHGVRAHDTTNSIMTTPNSDLAERTFDFTRDANNTNSNQTDSDLNITESSDNPDDTEVSVSKSNTTSNVLVIASDIEAQQSDITLSDIFVTIESDHTDVRDVVRSLRLMQGNTTLDTGEVVQNGGTPITAQDSNGDRQTLVDADEYYVHFTSIDNLTIREGDTETVELRVSFEKQSNSTYDDNTDITFTVRAIEGRDQDDNRIVANDLDIGSNSTFTLQVN
jgi:hypothetical protein